MILPLIGTCLSPWFLLWGGIQSIMLLSRGTIPGDLKAFIIAEMIGNFLLGLLWLWAIVLLFGKRRSYPRIFITASLGSLAFLGADLLVAAVQFHLPPNADDIKGLVRGFVGSAIWCPYMLVSKRVENTFIY